MVFARPAGTILFAWVAEAFYFMMIIYDNEKNNENNHENNNDKLYIYCI